MSVRVCMPALLALLNFSEKRSEANLTGVKFLPRGIRRLFHYGENCFTGIVYERAEGGIYPPLEDSTGAANKIRYA